MTVTERIYDKLIAIEDAINEALESMNEKKETIEERAYNRESGEMTEAEERRYNDLEDQMQALEDCLEHLQEAYGCL